MLYKYADINDNFTINNLINNQLGFNRIENFNDPFDTTPVPVINREVIIKYINSQQNISDDEKKKCVLCLKKNKKIYS